ncbi:hypothetical protein DB35_23715 [Streptomyces abyssalis]|uniref:Uncharacterized protein n=1 Tax=Streptomyces abyssalis TaxID=933944 RepID=A0A1E7JNW3_9ACTN|nr:hypothetical protein [Streptomyces abyssalis]OEU86678.1 hypothetical protein DB35_23715 [Streptomyces abyssalis]OEU89935.1 hypothetical protein AN215_09820 [Streptomyces abyssalis]OEV04448.1 hypothetical protein AN219_37290 [Streptomyces nanshensis]
MNHIARRIGRSLALVLPVVLVLSGTLAVVRVPWSSSSSSSTQMLTASEHRASTKATYRAPQDALRDRLVAELQEKDPGVALTSLQQEMSERPSLARHCASLARALGRAAVQKYGSVQRASSWSRPVCDTSFATGASRMLDR